MEITFKNPLVLLKIWFKMNQLESVRKKMLSLAAKNKQENLLFSENFIKSNDSLSKKFFEISHEIEILLKNIFFTLNIF